MKVTDITRNFTSNLVWLDFTNIFDKHLDTGMIKDKKTAA